MKLGKVFKILNGYAFSSSDAQEKGIKWVKIADVGINQMKTDKLSYLPKEFLKTHKKFILKKGDYVIALTRPILNGKLKLAKINELFHNSLLNQRVGKIESKNILRFVYCLLQRNILINQIDSNIAGTDPPNLSPSSINTIKIKIPSLSEQQKIANFLTAIDSRIQQLTRKIELLKQYKKGVMQQIFSQKVLFNKADGTDYEDWEKIKLSKVLDEHKCKSEGTEEVFSVSVHKGLINQIEHLGRSFAAKDTNHYNLVKPNDIVYTKSPTGDFPYGIIKQSRTNKNVIVSPLYGVFTPETPALGYILNEYFASIVNTHNYLHPIIQKGAKNTINITNSNFISKAIKLPRSKKEQQKIADFLTAIDEKISLSKEQLDKMQTYKRGLLQQMFV